MARKRQPVAVEGGLKDQIREAIRNSGRSLQQIGKECRIGADRLSRFVRGERSLSLDAAEKVCQVLHLGLARLPGEPPAPSPPKPPRRPKGGRSPGQPAPPPEPAAAPPPPPSELGAEGPKKKPGRKRKGGG
jgi:transcriptional regulator with XRE-family HTH domain